MPDIDSRQGDNVQPKKPRKNAKAGRANRTWFAFTVTIRDVDLPAFFSDGTIYIQAPLALVCDAFDADIPAIKRDLETGVSKARGTPLPPVDLRNPVPGTPLGGQSVVRDSGERR
jgi:hypothetical protein